MIEDPASQTKAFLFRGKYFMLNLITSKTHEPPCKGQEVFIAFRKVHSQLTAVVIGPVSVQITDRRKPTVIVGAKLIEVPLVETSRGINGHMDFIVLQAEKQLLIQITDKLSNPVEVNSDRWWGAGFIDPLDIIAPDGLVDLKPLLLSDSGLLKGINPFLKMFEPDNSINFVLAQELIAYSIPILGKTVGDEVEKRIHIDFVKRPTQIW